MKILISGAGIAGLSLARALQDIPDCDITLIERRDDLPLNTAGIALPANAVAALRMLGVGEAVDKIAHQVSAIRYTDEHEQVLAEASLLVPPLNLDKFVALTRDDLRKILLEGLKVPIQFKTTIETIKNNHDVALVTLSTSPEQVVKYDLVVAADGIHSRLRLLEGEDRNPLVDHGVINWRFILPHDTRNVQPTYQFGYYNSKLLLTYPISDDQVYIYAHYVPHKEVSKEELHDPQFFKSIFSEFTGLAGKMRDKLGSNTTLLAGRLESVPSANFYNKRVAFVGDAANACSPMLQQGAAAALEDILTLSTMLKTYPIDKALELYKSTRKERVKWLINGSDRPLKFMLALNRYFGDWIATTVRKFLFYLKGPLNVAGWKTLLSINPLPSLLAIQAGVTEKAQTSDSDYKPQNAQAQKAVIFSPLREEFNNSFLQEPVKSITAQKRKNKRH